MQLQHETRTIHGTPYEAIGAKKYLQGGQGVREGQNMAKNKLVTQLDDLSPGTSALFIYISNIQRTQKYSAVMY